MARRWRLLLIALLLVLAIFRSVNAYDDDDDDGDDEDEEEYYHEQEMDYGLFHHQKEEVITNTFIHTITFQQPSQVIPATTVTVTVRDATTTVPVVGVGTSNPAPDVPQAYNETLDFEGLEEGLGTCSDQGLTNEIFRWFTGIFFGDFYTFGGTDILGPLAVKGTFIAPDYVVNAEKDVDCSAANSVQSYGLVVGGSASTRNTQVHGSVFVAGGGDLSELKQLEGDCLVTGTQRTGLVDFVALEKEAVGISDIYRKHEPTLQLQSDGSLKRLDIVDNGVDYLTFNSCNDQPSCQNIWKDEMSVFDNIFGGVGNWNGIQGDIKPDPNITYVFNIPVMEDTTITLKTNEPINGFNPCKVVLNFYPVNRNSGAYSPTGAFTILRNTSGQLGGLTLAPRGNIRDGTTGNFAGNIIALSYTWAFTNGVEIHNYKAVGGECDSFDGCNPEPRKTPDCANKGTTSTTTATATATVTQQLTVVNDVTQFTTQTDTKTETSSFTETKTDSFTETKTDRFTETKTDSYTETKTDRFTETKTDSYTETQTDNYTTTRTVQVLQVKYIDRTTTTTDSYTTTTTDSFTETETNNIAATATITSTITQDPETTTATETETETGTTTATTTEYSLETFTEVSVNTTVATTTQFNTDTETTTTTEFSTNTATSTTTEFQTDTATTTTTEVSLNTATTTEISLSTVTNINNVTTTETTTTTETETTRGLVIGGGGGDVTYTEIETDTEELYLTVTQTVAMPTGNYVAETSTETVTVTDFPAPPTYTSLTEPLTYIYTQVLTYTHTHDQYCGHKYQEEDDEDGDDYDEEDDDKEDDDEDEDDCDEEDDDDADHHKKNY